MFEVGDFIIYGNNGVCRVDAVGATELAGLSKDRMYYTLSPIYERKSRLFTPVDNEKVIMRAVISKEEAYKLLEEIKKIDFLWVQDEKRREESYKEAFRKCDYRELAKMIKAIYFHKEARQAEGKKISASDDRYFHIAEETLYGELAISFDMDKEKVKEVVIASVESQGDN